jgi:hypothetical protein
MEKSGEKIQVVDWVKWSDEAIYRDQTREYEDAVIDCIVKNKYRFDGNTHQRHEHGVPLFNDGKVWQASMRSWGGTMAEAWNTIEDKYNYMYLDFYIGFNGDKDPLAKIPTGKEIV